ncbi:MAG: class I SAM-dependent methyltransferase, partial [Cytophagales bacterium]|nr:class I SAM-dependent methyltransferase [Cytophagales bacterium]
MITAPMITDKLQQIQDDEYTFPYHYVSQFENNFTQCFNDIWGINYIATIEFMLARLAATPFESLVDVGCGDGRLTYEIQKRFPARTVWGIDYSQRAINLAKAMNPRGNYLQADITQPSSLPAFDAAVLMEVFEHIPPAVAPAFLGGVAGLLKRGGVLFITVPHVNKPVEYKHFRHFS